MDLFQEQDFISHAGIPMTWKIEMDALTDAEWAACGGEGKIPLMLAVILILFLLVPAVLYRVQSNGGSEEINKPSYL